MRRLVLLAGYLCLLPFVILTFMGYLLVLINSSAPKNLDTVGKSSFQAIPKQSVASTYLPQEREARVEVLEEFFKRYNSPLSAYANHIVEQADRYSIDWRLIPAIAMQESTLCKKIPKDSYNCWGFGIYNGKITRFSDYKEAIEVVTKTLAQDYKEDRGLENPYEIVTRYTPGSTTWADKVTLVMTRIEELL